MVCCVHVCCYSPFTTHSILPHMAEAAGSATRQARVTVISLILHGKFSSAKSLLSNQG